MKPPYSPKVTTHTFLHSSHTYIAYHIYIYTYIRIYIHISVYTHITHTHIHQLSESHEATIPHSPINVFCMCVMYYPLPQHSQHSTPLPSLTYTTYEDMPSHSPSLRHCHYSLSLFSACAFVTTTLSHRPAMSCQVNFEAPAHLQERRKKAARWAPNPEEGWGPKRRAGRGGWAMMLMMMMMMMT